MRKIILIILKGKKIMKKNLTIAIMLVLFGINLYSQGYVTLQSGETTTFHKSVASAYDKAVNGDIILIPGGIWSLPANIEKEISFIGAGYDPRYSAGTNVTAISNSKVIIKNSNIMLEGLLFIGGSENSDHIQLGSASENLENIIVSRCKFARILKSQKTTLKNILIKESVLGSLQVAWQSCLSCMDWNSTMVSNCFIIKKPADPNNVVYENNIFFVISWEDSMNGNCIFRNNIFTHAPLKHHVRNSSFFNNIFCNPDALIPSNGSGVISNNIYGVSLVNVFEEIPSETEWHYDFNIVYKLKSNSPAKNAGDDGTDCGVWGGEYPWKESAVPLLPYIKEAKISPQTKASGKLNVEFKVEAQGK